MAFKFGLEAVLKHRKRLEEVAQREFAEAQAAVDRCLNEIEQMYNRIDEVRVDIATAEKEGSARKMSEIRDMEFFINGQKLRIERARLRARELLQIAEQRHEVLVTASQERKIMVKLKEKKLVEYKAWLNSVEAKELDDVTMVRQARRKT